MDERQKMYELIDGLFNELKSLLANYPNNRVDFEFDEDDVYYCGDEEYERNEFIIYCGASWYYDDEVVVKSIYVEDDKLYFDGSWMAWNYIGNVCGKEEFDHISVELLCNRNQHDKFLAEQLKFFVDILKK